MPGGLVLFYRCHFAAAALKPGRSQRCRLLLFFAVRPPICAACIDETRSDQYNEGRGIQELVNQPRTGGYYETKSKAFNRGAIRKHEKTQ